MNDVLRLLNFRLVYVVGGEWAEEGGRENLWVLDELKISGKENFILPYVVDSESIAKC